MNLLELALHGKFCAHRGGRCGIPVQQIAKRFICLVLILLVQLRCDVLVAMPTSVIACVYYADSVPALAPGWHRWCYLASCFGHCWSLGCVRVPPVEPWWDASEWRRLSQTRCDCRAHKAITPKCSSRSCFAFAGACDWCQVAITFFQVLEPCVQLL